MEQWLDLMFGNPMGLLSMITILGAIVIVGFIAVMLAKKSAQKPVAHRRGVSSSTRARSITT